MADHFLYLYDPLCGWCYGAAVGIRTLAALTDVTVDVLPTGLFARPDAGPLSEQMAQHIWTSDQRIAELTGARFSERYHDLLAARTPLDSTLATLALTAVSLSAPQRELELLGVIQTARYVGGRDITDMAVLVDLLTSADLAAAASTLTEAGPVLAAANAARIRKGSDLMNRFDVRGVPTLFQDKGHGVELVDTHAVYSNPRSLLTEALV